MSEKNEKIYLWAVGQSFKKLDPRQQLRNPVMFVVYLGAILTTILCFYPMDVPLWFSLAITVFLWLTLLFANFAEAVAEGRGKAQADSLKQAKKEVMTYKITCLEDVQEKNFIEIRSSDLKKAIWFMSRQVNKSQQTGTLLKGLPPSMKVPLLENQHQSFGNPEGIEAL